MFTISGDLDTTSKSHEEAILSFLTSPAMLVPEQGPVQPHHLRVEAVASDDFPENAWFWELTEDAPRIGDVDDDPPQVCGVVAWYTRFSAYVVTVDSGERLPVDELLGSGPPA